MPEMTFSARMRCQKHGEHQSYMWIQINGLTTCYCLACLHEVLTRLGVHGMFPVGSDAPLPDVEWPEKLDVED